MRDNLVKVTTTSGFDGVPIDEYMEPVTAHIVVGMNFFKDFFAGFTDFFGGKSNSYQKVLAQMNQEVIDELKRKTLALGGNCILGLKIDNDEVSAKDKSMLMVTAIGTAAKADFSKQITKSSGNSILKSIDLDYFNYLKQKNYYFLASENENLELSEEFWDFINSNKTFELAPYVLERYLKYIKSTQQLEETISLFTNKVIDFLSVLDKQYALNTLYEKYFQFNETSPRIRIIHMLESLNLVDFNNILSLIKSGSFVEQKAGLQFLRPQKGTYFIEDLPLIESLLEVIPQHFNERCQRATKKKLLSAKEKDIWICECGKENDQEDSTCKNCNKDPYGFYWFEKKPDELIEKLEIEKQILNSILSGDTK